MVTAERTARRILLVEDNPADAFLIQELLFQTATPPDQLMNVASVADALLQLSSQSVDVILLDLGLPDASGMECFNAVHAHSGSIPIVVLTGREEDEVSLEYVRAGAQDYIPKRVLQTDNLRRAINYADARAKEALERHRADELHRRHAAIVEASSDAIISMTLDGVITSWNSGAARIFGVPAQAAVGQYVKDVVHTEEASGSVDVRRSAFLVRQRFDAVASDMVCLRDDGSRVTVSVVACQLNDATGRATAVAAICRDVTMDRLRDEEIRKRNTELLQRDSQMRNLTARMNQVVEEERTRISREIHDEFGRLLTPLKMDLHWIGRRIQDHPVDVPSVLVRLTEAEQMVDDIVTTMHGIAVDLRPMALDTLGLSAAIRDEARRFATKVGVSVDVDLRTAGSPGPEVATSLFRILQELLTNIARHAFASSVSISFDASEQDWLLDVIDDGVGVSDSKPDGRQSLGLLGVRERAATHGGGVRISRAMPRGTVASVRIPKEHSYQPDAL